MNEKKFWCIWCNKEYRVIGNDDNRLCHDREKVISEAMRLASDNPKREYIVLEAMASYITKVPDVITQPLL